MVTASPPRRDPLRYQRPPLWDLVQGGRPYVPLAWQAKHLHIPVDKGFKRIALPCGRRAGKSEAVKAEVVRGATQGSEMVLGVEHFPVIYICGPTSELAMRVWEPVWDMFVPSMSADYVPPLGFMYLNHDKQRGIIWLKNGTRIQRKTGDDARSLQGERVTLAIVDEAQDFPAEAWENLLPALSDSGGLCIAIGITRGKGRFRSLYQLGQQGERMHYSASVPTAANPIMHDKAAELGFRDLDEYIDIVLAPALTENEKRQQYYAEWVDEDGQVFTNPEQVFTGDWNYEDAQPEKGHTYFIGCDLAKLQDYTVAYVGDVCCQKIVAQERFHHLDYTIQVPKLAALANKWRPRIFHIDATGSEGTVDFLRPLLPRSCSLIAFKFSVESKSNLVSALVRETERVNYTMPKGDSIAKSEMQLYEGTVSGSHVKYSAPPGYYDDCVMALALLVYLMAKQKRWSVNPMQKPYVSFTQPSEATRVSRMPMARKPLPPSKGGRSIPVDSALDEALAELIEAASKVVV